MDRSPLAPAAFPPLPPIAGVRLATAACGMKYQNRDDVMLIQTSPDSVIAGVFTQSDAAAAPVLWCQPRCETASVILTNAGNANAFTGAHGMADIESLTADLSTKLDCTQDAILMASTGVIGEPLDTACLAASFDRLLDSEAECEWHAAADAIRTTDTFAKGASAQCTLDGTVVTVSGIAKGSGMIAPNMATMLGYVATDAAVTPNVLATLLRDANQRSFNAITVDSDTSTNDSVFLIATGAAGNSCIDAATHPDYAAFAAAVDDVMQQLAQLIVRDGEGASKFITIDVSGAADDAIAHQIAMTIANSPLVKTAIAGEDANWGRIIMAVGKAEANIDQRAIAITIGGIAITADGARRADYDEGPVAAHMQGNEIDIGVSVGTGAGAARVWTCDLTHGYITINADYRS